MAEIIIFNDYKRAHGIALPRSPYYTLKATQTEIDAAIERAAEYMKKPLGISGMPYAVLMGYENKKTGWVKLLKEQIIYSSKEIFERSAGIGGHYVLALTRKES